MKKKKSDELHKIKTGSQNTANRPKLAEKLHRESDGKYISILENIREAYYEVDLAGNFIFFNDSLCRITGFSRGELAGLNYLKLSDKENSTKVVSQIFKKVYKTGKPTVGFNWPIIRKDGSRGYIEASVLLEKDSAGNPTGFKGIIRDITERKIAEKKLRAEEQRLRALSEQSLDIILLVNREGVIVYINHAVEKILGFKIEERIGRKVFENLHPDDLNLVTDAFNTLIGNENAPVQKDEVRLRHSDGEWRTFEIVASNLAHENVVEAIVVNLRDITERKNAEELLKQRESQYRLLADHMKDQVWLMDLNLNLKYISPSVEKLIGYTLKELRQIPLDKIITPTNFRTAMDFVATELPKALAAPADYSLNRLLELEIICKDGQTVWLEYTFSFIRDENGKPVSILGEGRDITERKLAENALKKSEERYRSVFENAGLPMVIMEDSLLIFMVNDRFVEMSGYEKNEIEGMMKFTDFITSGDRNALMECFSRRTGDKHVEYECRITHRNGKQFDVLIRMGYIPGACQFIASFTDITSRKQAEVALLESREHLQKENIRLRSSIRERYRFCDIIGKSQVMQNVYEFILKAAETQDNVIIYGESGTGKELVAKAIHETSDRSRKGFVTVHCGAVPETLMESEFFGYKKGAFTGANMDKRGYLEEADGGTLFLDEVGEIGLNMQIKLLRAIAGDGYAPVGSSTTKKTDVRIIAATNRNLRDLVKQGIMREDFFYRIYILPIYLPLLRERKEDLPLLIDHFLQLYDENHTPLPGHISESLLQYDWPGNVRELQNVLHRYLTLKRLDFEGVTTISPTRLEWKTPKDDVSVRPSFVANTFSGGQAQQAQDHHGIHVEETTMNLKILERSNILRALSEHNWHRGRTASALGINRKTLFLKMQKLGLSHP